MNKSTFYGIVIAGVLGIGLGYYLAPKASTSTEQQNNNIITHETTTTQTNKKGTTKTTIVKEIIDKSKIEKEVVVVPKKPSINISALAAVNPSLRHYESIYGISVSKEVFGPFTAGAFGLTDGTLGLSLGINF